MFLNYWLNFDPVAHKCALPDNLGIQIIGGPANQGSTTVHLRGKNHSTKPVIFKNVIACTALHAFR